MAGRRAANPPLIAASNLPKPILTGFLIVFYFLIRFNLRLIEDAKFCMFNLLKSDHKLHYPKTD
jgi:hypothetical protein